MKNKTLRNDLIVIVILFLIIEGLFFFKSRKQGQLIEITKDNQIYGYYSLNEDQIIKIDQENTIQIKNQKVKMIQATCPDHLCIKQGTIDKKGSTPRTVGSMMFVNEKGLVGSIGGGREEYQAILDAKNCQKVMIKHYELNNSESANLGMICGGSNDVLFLPIKQH